MRRQSIMATTNEKLEFPNGRGQVLAGRLDRPQGQPKAYALFAHCFTCSKDVLAASRISTALAEQGIAVLRFDFTGLGGSEGDFANTNFSSNVDDLVAAAEHLKAHFQAPKILIGHSLGGAAVLRAAARVPDAAAVATIGAPCDPEHVARQVESQRAEIEARGEAQVSLGGRTFTITRQFLEDLAAHPMQEAIGKLRKALLVMHSPLDEVVGIDNATRIFVAAKHPKSFVSLDRADHLLSRRADSAYVATVLAAWASRYVAGEAGTLEEGPSLRSEPGVVLVAESGDGPYAQAISASGHALRADEPERAGGHDTGPNPYDLLMSALGACTSMTLRMYANHKQWPLGRVSVRLTHEKIHAADCAECETKDGKLDRFDRVIAIEGDLDDEQRARLLQIADRCPVHRTLHSEVHVVTRLAE
jgi:putative redox protein